MRTIFNLLPTLSFVLVLVFTMAIFDLTVAKACDRLDSDDSPYGIYYDNNIDLRAYLRENGWVDNRVTTEDLDYIILLAEQLSTQFDDPIDQALVLAMIAKESAFYNNCEYEGAVGLMQLLTKWHEQTLADICDDEPSFDKWYEPRYNIMCGLVYLDQLLNNEAEKDLTLALMMYNQGPASGAKTYLGKGITSDYAKDILAIRSDIRDIFGKGEVTSAETS